MRIRSLRDLLDSVERRVTNEEGNLNSLGEMQQEAGMLDCCIAVLMFLRQIKK